uniref:Uncharacterized protein n=1 Tax=Rhizophagus irregularis (strain DAOM 181602 / DAOM 197198 / MUCL 43194) TaxID=747089 RepID=U9TZC2_RHIID
MATTAFITVSVVCNSSRTVNIAGKNIVFAIGESIAAIVTIVRIAFFLKSVQFFGSFSMKVGDVGSSSKCNS